MLTKIKEWFVALHERFRGYRTIAFNVIAGAAPLLLLVLDFAGQIDATNLFSAKGAVAYGVFVNIANIALRYVTTSAVGEKAS